MSNNDLLNEAKKARVSVKISSIAAKALDKNINFKYVIPNENFEKARETLREIYNRSDNQVTGQFLYLFGLYGLALESAMPKEVRDAFQRVKPINYSEKNLYKVSANCLGLPKIVGESRLMDLYPEVVDTKQHTMDSESFIAHIGFVLLERIKAGELPAFSIDQNFFALINGDTIAHFEKVKNN